VPSRDGEARGGHLHAVPDPPRLLPTLPSGDEPVGPLLDPWGGPDEADPDLDPDLARDDPDFSSCGKDGDS
jgi:hypothetical protein